MLTAVQGGYLFIHPIVLWIAVIIQLEKEFDVVQAKSSVLKAAAAQVAGNAAQREAVSDNLQESALMAMA